MRLVPYPPLERHGLISDGRSAAIIAADGTLSWLCLPRFDSAPVFGALLDERSGGYWRLGPASPVLGVQRYVEDTGSLATSWKFDEGELELVDMMTVPDPRGGRAILRRLRCNKGAVEAFHGIEIRSDFGATIEPISTEDGQTFELHGHPMRLRLLTPSGMSIGDDGTFSLAEGESLWAILSIDGPRIQSERDAESTVESTEENWRHTGRLTYTGPRRDRIVRSGLLIRALTYEPSGAVIAAATTSLPERIGGDWNADYRFTWIRDASLSLAVLALLGQTETASRYMDWLVGLEPGDHAPLQVLYRVDGHRDLAQVDRADIEGYRGSRPVRLGNHAYRQRQLDAFGFPLRLRVDLPGSRRALETGVLGPRTPGRGPRIGDVATPGQ